MRLFLSSYRFGGHEQRFATLCNTPGPIAVIANAADAWPPAARAGAVTSEMAPLRRAGFDPIELDLRAFSGMPDALAAALDRFSAVWIRGGNTFVLRAQLAKCGADGLIVDRVRGESLVFGGYSAGACVASKSLDGLEHSDDPGEVRPATGMDPIRSGLGLVAFSIVPHVNSVLDENDSAARTIAQFTSESIDHRALTDEQAIVVDGSDIEVIGPR